MGQTLFTAYMRYRNGSRVRITLRPAVKGFIDSDGFLWDVTTGRLVAKKYAPKSESGLGAWVDKQGNQIARLVTTSIRPLKPENARAAFKQMTHIGLLRCGASRPTKIRLRSTANYWVDEQGCKFKKVDGCSVNIEHNRLSLLRVDPIPRHPNGLIKGTEE